MAESIDSEYSFRIGYRTRLGTRRVGSDSTESSNHAFLGWVQLNLSSRLTLLEADMFPKFLVFIYIAQENFFFNKSSLLSWYFMYYKYIVCPKFKVIEYLNRESLNLYTVIVQTDPTGS